MVIIVGLYLAKIGSPLVKMVDTAISEKLCLQVSHHSVKLCHRIADGRAYTHKIYTIISLIYRRRIPFLSDGFFIRI